MRHDDRIELLLPWYASGSLTAEERREVEQHLPGCASCRGLLEEARMAAELDDSDFDGLLDHVHAQHLDDFARRPDRMEDELAGWIRGHVDSCAVCADSLKQLRRSLELEEREGAARDRARASEDVIQFPLWRAIKGTVLHPAAAAVYLLAALVSIPVYRVVEESRSESEPIAGVPVAQPPAGDLGGVVDLHVVSSPLRGDDARTTIRLAEAGPLVTLGAVLDRPDGLGDTEEIEISIVDSSGVNAWSGSTTAETARRNLAHSGVVTLLVPVARLQPGPYRLVVRAAGNTLLDARVDVE